MRRWAGLFAGATAGGMAVASFVGCDLDLKPYVEPADGGPPIGPTVVDSGPTDPGDAGGDALASPDASDGGRIDGGAKRVFTTAATFNGNLGGVQGADQKCQAAAEGAKLEGRFIAWLSVVGDPVTGRLQGDGPWVFVDDRTVAIESRAALLEGGPKVALNRDEKNEEVKGSELVWTGTRSTGDTNPLNTCGGFILNDEVNGLAGSTEATNGQWTQSGNRACGQAHHLYCFEQ